VYRRILEKVEKSFGSSICSHDLARLCGGSAAQVRRDLMAIGALGRSGRGYDIACVKQCIDAFFELTTEHSVALVGVGTLGRSLIEYFNKWNHRLAVAAAFDQDPEKIGRIFQGVRCYSVEQMPQMVSQLRIAIAILAVPDTGAQQLADSLIAAGVKGLLNFAPVSLRVPLDVRVENINIAVALDKLAFFACKGRNTSKRGDG
jgi:redox-sensing transcriptional repressor